MRMHPTEIKRSIGEFEDEATGQVIVEHWKVSDANGNKSDTYAYDKNKQYKVEKGTKCAYVQLSFPFEKGRTFNGRNEMAQAAQQEAAMIWAARWGAIPWDLVQVFVTHVTTQVCVEFRVSPL